MKKRMHSINSDLNECFKKLNEYRAVRWGFLRLNEEYRADYDKFVVEKKKNSNKIRHYDFDVWISKTKKLFSEKWLIEPQDYDNDNPPMSTDPLYEPITMHAYNFPNVVEKCYLPPKGVPLSPKDKSGFILTFQTIMGLKINPHFPQHIILGLIKWMLDGLAYEKEVTLKAAGYSGKKTRWRLEDYKPLLKAYELKNDPKRKRTYKEVAAEIFKKSIEDVSQSDIGTISKRCNRCKHLIKQGIKAFHPLKIDLVSPTINR